MPVLANVLVKISVGSVTASLFEKNGKQGRKGLGYCSGRIEGWRGGHPADRLLLETRERLGLDKVLSAFDCMLELVGIMRLT